MRRKSILFPSNAENTCAYTNVPIKKRFNVIEKRLLHLTSLFRLILRLSIKTKVKGACTLVLHLTRVLKNVFLSRYFCLRF